MRNSCEYEIKKDQFFMMEFYCGGERMIISNNGAIWCNFQCEHEIMGQRHLNTERACLFGAILLSDFAIVVVNYD
jgi:hypothetical protein